MLGGAPDLLARLRVLRGQVNELSPVWAMNFISHGDRNCIAVFPKPGSPPQRVVVHLDANAEDPGKQTLVSKKYPGTAAR